MSRSGMFFFSNFIKETIKGLSPKSMTIISGGTVISHLIYTLGTTHNETINIKHKYKFDTNGFTNFMVIDDNNKHYNVNNSLWYWKWDSIEDWNSIKLNKTNETNETNKLSVKYYGLRIPFLGFFPNIVKIK